MVIFENSQCVSNTSLYRRVDVSAFTEFGLDFGPVLKIRRRKNRSSNLKTVHFIWEIVGICLQQPLVQSNGESQSEIVRE